MEIYNFKKTCGKRITHYSSNFVMTKILQTSEAASIGVMYLEENEIVGYHQAITPQLLLIVSGTGFVSVDQKEYVQVEEGDAIFWQQGEWHETKTEIGMKAVVIEGNEINPSLLLS